MLVNLQKVPLARRVNQSTLLRKVVSYCPLTAGVTLLLLTVLFPQSSLQQLLGHQMQAPKGNLACQELRIVTAAAGASWGNRAGYCEGAKLCESEPFFVFKAN